mmetsp:Transcript_48529/g.96612  ORF Transcript_48529/g.96612 Transcript_48529/m.96612 type:complete len:274 (+) Transcript_48529:270-1091(+)
MPRCNGKLIRRQVGSQLHQTLASMFTNIVGEIAIIRMLMPLSLSFPHRLFQKLPGMFTNVVGRFTMINMRMRMPPSLSFHHRLLRRLASFFTHVVGKVTIVGMQMPQVALGLSIHHRLLHALAIMFANNVGKVAIVSILMPLGLSIHHWLHQTIMAIAHVCYLHAYIITRLARALPVQHVEAGAILFLLLLVISSCHVKICCLGRWRQSYGAPDLRPQGNLFPFVPHKRFPHPRAAARKSSYSGKSPVTPAAAIRFGPRQRQDCGFHVVHLGL